MYFFSSDLVIKTETHRHQTSDLEVTKKVGPKLDNNARHVNTRDKTRGQTQRDEREDCWRRGENEMRKWGGERTLHWYLARFTMMRKRKDN